MRSPQTNSETKKVFNAKEEWENMSKSVTSKPRATAEALVRKPQDKHSAGVAAVHTVRSPIASYIEKMSGRRALYIRVLVKLINMHTQL